ncbi:hypothetical protein FGO68_gene14716 [Halteria grandinella]|uniref:Uncharacterized protein n=1 Tax=Halteria grandinella TaxID=5974 RepID=A0A8J8NMN4_HALGN|nr:hypothetical protein FGO68_gene14716 [Halteria grandinella]
MSTTFASSASFDKLVQSYYQQGQSNTQEVDPMKRGETLDLMAEFEQFKTKAFCNQQCYQDFAISTLFHNPAQRETIERLLCSHKPDKMEDKRLEQMVTNLGVGKDGDMEMLMQSMFKAGYHMRALEK